MVLTDLNVGFSRVQNSNQYRRTVDRSKASRAVFCLLIFCKSTHITLASHRKIQDIAHTEFNHPIQKSQQFGYPQAKQTMASNNVITRLGTTDPRMSQIVVHNGVVYLSGQVDEVETDVAGQTKSILNQIDNLLAQAGTDKSRLLTAKIWLKDINKDFKTMNEVWKAWVDADNKPVRATVEATLALPEILVEVQVTAALK
jgi:enamine deaminase RidA (YjgF/YER057c/UK114 family)